MSTQDPQQPQFSEEELRAIEAEMQKITVDDVLLQTIVTLLNVGARKSGLAAPEGQAAPEPDLEQVRQAIEGARALLPIVEPRHGDQLGPIKDALSRLQMFYAQRAGGQPPSGGGEPPQGEPEPAKEGPGPAQSSGRLWVPGQ
jgi:hypothetical protein